MLDPNNFPPPCYNLLRENGVGNLVDDCQTHHTNNIGACRVAFVTASDHGGVPPPVVSRTCRGETFFTHLHDQERLGCFITDWKGNPRGCFTTVVHFDHDPQVVNLHASRHNSRPLSEFNQPAQCEICPVQTRSALSPTGVISGSTDFQSSQIRNAHCS